MKKKPVRPSSGNVRITLRMPPNVVEAIDDLNRYIPQGDRADMVRFLMNLGVKQLRLEQSAREQVDIFQKFTSVLSGEMEKAAADHGQSVLPFPAPEPKAKRKTRPAKRSGSSSTGTKSH